MGGGAQVRHNQANCVQKTSQSKLFIICSSTHTYQLTQHLGKNLNQINSAQVMITNLDARFVDFLAPSR